MSLGGSCDPSSQSCIDPGSIDIYAYFQNILTQDYTPILHITTTIAYLIGLCFIIAGLMRLYRHGQGQQMMYRVSPLSTTLYFIAGIVLISFVPYLNMLSNSFFGTTVNDVLMTQCQSPDVNASGFYTGSNSFCPMLAYASDISNAQSTNDIASGVKYMVFALMFLVGIIAFIRGMIVLVKLGEGSQGHSLGRALTFIIAGIVAINMDSVYGLLGNILSGTAGNGPSI